MIIQTVLIGIFDACNTVMLCGIIKECDGWLQQQLYGWGFVP
jgi:hypothetical protein